ncbi:MAG: patatin-like phospholipase family protein [Firmicutes bacterium]|nr:patatin-like phospholipase family protein [Bacillota bacterium]
MAQYRILTFDGGGIRGALSVNLLQRLTEDFPELLPNTRFFAGTSTGSFIALGLAYGLAPADLADLYSEEKGKFIFTPSHIEVFKPKYKNEHLRQALCSVFPEDLRLKDLKHRVLVPSFRVSGNGTGSWRPIFFNNFPNSTTADVKVIDAALSSSAAPVYFPSYQSHIDGGVIANNPSTAAIALAGDEQGGGQELDDVCLLSLGTGFSPQRITADTTQWGAFEWALYPKPTFPLLSVLLDGVVELDVYFSRQLLRKRFHRINPALTKPIDLDDYKKIPYLVALAESYDLQPTIDWLNQNWL